MVKGRVTLRLLKGMNSMVTGPSIWKAFPLDLCGFFPHLPQAFCKVPFFSKTFLIVLFKLHHSLGRLNSGPQRSPGPNLWNIPLYGKRDFAGVTKLRRLRYPGMPKCNH